MNLSQTFHKLAKSHVEQLRDPHEGRYGNAFLAPFKSLPMSQMKAVLHHHIAQGPSPLLAQLFDARSEFYQPKIVRIMQPSLPKSAKPWTAANSKSDTQVLINILDLLEEKNRASITYG